MGRYLLLLVTATALLAAPVRASADIIDIDSAAGNRFERSVRVAPGKFAEVCGKFAKGAEVRWRFDADVPLDFNVHFHEGKKVTFPVKHDATAKADGTLSTTQDQTYCWMWTDKGGRGAALAFKLER